MLNLSGIFGKFFSGCEDDPSVDPVVAAVANLALDQVAPEMINVATWFVCWWSCRERIVWRIRTETASQLSQTGLYFLPETPPASWRGNAVVIESENVRLPLADEYCPIMACRTVAPTTGKLRYYFVCLDLQGARFLFLQIEGRLPSVRFVTPRPFQKQDKADRRSSQLSHIRGIWSDHQSSFILRRFQRLSGSTGSIFIRRSLKRPFCWILQTHS